MNYQGNEILRHEIAQLGQNMDKLKQQITELEKKYRWSSDNLSHALAGHALHVAEHAFTVAHQHIWELEVMFKD